MYYNPYSKHYKCKVHKLTENDAISGTVDEVLPFWSFNEVLQKRTLISPAMLLFMYKIPISTVSKM